MTRIGFEKDILGRDCAIMRLLPVVSFPHTLPIHGHFCFHRAESALPADVAEFTTSFLPLGQTQSVNKKSLTIPSVPELAWDSQPGSHTRLMPSGIFCRSSCFWGTYVGVLYRCSYIGVINQGFYIKVIISNIGVLLSGCYRGV